jgi:hypothetical protein
LCSTIQPRLLCWLMKSEYLYTVSFFILSHMYTTDPFSCKLMCSLTKYVSDTKCTHFTVLSNKLSEQIILVCYCSNMVWSNTIGMLLQIHYLCNFCGQHYVHKIMVHMDIAHAKHHLVRMFKHLMISVKITLCLESQETITELSLHTSTHTLYK